MYQVRGQFHVSLDDKGRLALPARLREALNQHSDESLVLTYFDNSIHGYTLATWRRIEERVAGIAPFERRNRAFIHSFVAGASEVAVDKLGRMLLPQYLRQKAGLGKEIVVLSYLGQIEVWDLARWEARLEQADEVVGETGGPDEFLVGLEEPAS